MRIVFMGTPDFAVPSLRRLLEDGHEVVAVFTQPDKPKNRGMKLTFSPVKEYALTQNIAVYQPATMRDGEALSILQRCAPELVVVAAYGKILPDDILSVAPCGSINVHSSILPKYRGAAPINHAILNGETETGVTIMHMAHDLDAGDIIHILKTPIDPTEDAAQLTARLATLGAQALSEAVCAIENGTATRTPQDHSKQTYASMLSREMSPVDWNSGAQHIINQIRGLIPWPCATASLGGTNFKLFAAKCAGAADALPGTILSAGKDGIRVACGAGESIIITELQAEGGKRMAAADYLRGHPMKI